MRVTLIAGARPNFIKIAPIIDAIKAYNERSQFTIHYRLVHTGQHYDKNMSEQFFAELGIDEPDDNLGAGGGTQAEQTANIMIRFEEHLRNNPSDLVLVVGDVTSTLACSIVAKKMLIDVAHVEAGIRSGDRTMPEEINRLVTDAITDHFFTTTEVANNYLRQSGVSENKIHFVGNVMIDTLLKHQHRFTAPALFYNNQLQQQQYFVLTLHRPSNVDNEAQLVALLNAIKDGVGELPVIFPIHPRTARNMQAAGISMPENFIIAEPMSYLNFNYLVKHAKAVITDSGGITEETTVMGVPCITLRDTTERPETVTIGTNELIGTDPAAIGPALEKIMNGQWKKGGIPELWDGKTANRIIEIISGFYKK